MTTYFVVETIQGPNWNSNIEMRKQENWTEHANFMNNLETEGFVVLGGPIYSTQETKENHIHTAMLIVDSYSELVVRQRLSDDPWSKNKLLEIKSVRKWDILLDRSSPVR